MTEKKGAKEDTASQQESTVEGSPHPETRTRNTTNTLNTGMGNVVRVKLYVDLCFVG